ncbi:WXG100 family type VII secretion target [Streptomyces sp. NPDC097619]|uniref:WXG100 family type VII secretion target n=1 Tax=Streptomyces sp. NPDC097619 TaxID=3157228 RepID=UPI00332B073F
MLAVNYDTVATAAGDVRRTAHKLSQDLERLMAQVRVVTAAWEGEAMVAYADIQGTVTREMTGMNAKLGAIATLLDTSLTGYQDTDRGNAARFRML